LRFPYGRDGPLSLRALRSFVAIARHGSFAAAAAALGLTQSAVSLQMRGLEQALRARLFDRARRAPTLTAAGRALVARAGEIVALYDGLPAALAGPELAGTLVLGAVPTVLSGVLPDALVALRARHPQVQVRVIAGLSAELAALVERGEADAACVSEPAIRLPAGLAWREFARERLLVIAPPDAPAGSDRALLARYPFIRFNRRAWAGRLIDAQLRRRAIAVNEVMELDSLEAIALMVSRGLGASIVPERAAGVALPARLVRRPFGRPPLIRRLGLVERAGHPRAALTAALLARLRAAAGRVRAAG
jgi:DNA-binding transcriptional LysR family regulator